MSGARGRRLAWLAVAANELWWHARRRTFLFTTALVPLVGLLLSLATGVGGAVMVRQLGSAFELQELQRVQTAARIGLVDPAGFLTRHPAAAGGAPGLLASEAAARAALEGGTVDVVFLLSPDYPRDATVTRLAPTGALAAEDREELYRLLRANLWPEAGAAALADLAEPLRRVQIARVAIPAGRPADAAARLRDDPSSLLTPLLLGVLLYSAIFMSSSFLLQSVTTEKENRLMEVLLTSVSTDQLLAGKMLGLGTLGLAQLAFWGLAGLALGGAGILATAQQLGARLDARALAWLPVFFVLGYAFYASLMAGVGALVPSFQESGALTFLVLLPAWLPFFVLPLLLAEPNGTLARLFSVIPPTAPLVMLLRLSVTIVPRVEILLSVLSLAVGTVLVAWTAARLFRVSLLLAGAMPAPREVWAVLARRA